MIQTGTKEAEDFFDHGFKFIMECQISSFRVHCMFQVVEARKLKADLAVMEKKMKKNHS